MNLEELQALIAVVDHGSVLSAADALGVARTTLRRRLDELEARAGVPLIHRMTSGAAPTESGRVLVEHGRRMLREADALIASVRELGTEPAGVVRVVVPPGMPPHVVSTLIAAQRHRFPQLRLDLRIGTDTIDGLLTDVDLALQLGATLPTGPWVAFVLHRFPERLVASRAWVDAHGAPATLDALHAHPVMCWSPPDRTPGALPLLGGGTFEVVPAFASADIHLVRQCALDGLGIACVPEGFMPDPTHASDALVPILADVVGRTIAARVVVPEALIDVPKVKVLVDQVRAFVATLPS